MLAGNRYNWRSEKISPKPVDPTLSNLVRSALKIFLGNKQKKTDFLIARNYFNYLWKSHFEWRPQQTTKQSARQFNKKTTAE